MKHFCTIITPDYFHYVKTLFTSLRKNFSEEVFLHVLLSESPSNNDIKSKSDFKLEGLEVYYSSSIHEKIAANLKEKYAKYDMDAYRWSMKPVFMNFLLAKVEIEKLIYLDSDIYFVGNGDFIFEELDDYDILLSPHWRCAENPKVDFENFQKNFTEGIFNGGFVAASKGAKNALKFWATCCLASCEKNVVKGFYVDQKYLEILHSRFHRIGVLRHRGCNLAEWNRVENERVLDSNNKLTINHKYTPVFIHFTGSTISSILSGADPLLEPYLNNYANSLTEYMSNKYDIRDKYLSKGSAKSDFKPFSWLKDSVRLRTRVRAFLKG